MHGAIISLIMDKSPQVKSPVTNAFETYLSYYEGSPEATAHAVAVLQQFEWMVDLAVSRAVDALYVPTNVVEIKRNPLSVEAE